MQLPRDFENYSIISCDVFDTLLIRDSVTPSRLWKQQGSLFQPVRIGTEFLVRKLARFNGRAEILISDIYRHLPRAWTVEIEIALEVQSLRINPEILEWLQKASVTDVRVVLISDIYFTTDQLRQILEAVGIPRFEVITSGSEGSTKSKGLFALLSARWDIPHHRWLHIGDNLQSDVKAPSRLGIKAIHYPKILDQVIAAGILSQKGAEKLLREGRAGETLLTEMSLQFARFNVERGDTPPSLDEYIGALICAPVAESISNFVQRIAQEEAIQVIWFSGRDGWLPFLHIMEMKTNLRVSYFPVSRIATDSSNFAVFLHRMIGNDNKVLVYDIGWQGSLLSRLQELEPAITWKGAFVALIRPERSNEFQMATRLTRNWASLVRNRDVIETLFSDPTPGVETYDAQGNPLYKADLDHENSRLRLAILEGANWAIKGSKFEGDPKVALNLLQVTCTHPSRKLAARFVGLRHDININRKRIFVVKNWRELQTQKDISWWAGARALGPSGKWNSLSWGALLFYREYWILSTRLLRRGFITLRRIR